MVLHHNPAYLPMCVDPNPMQSELTSTYAAINKWIGLSSIITGQYQELHSIESSDIPIDIDDFRECVFDATQWFTWKIEPTTGITIIPPNIATIMTFDIAD
jgi:hypothetical protein